MATIILGMLKLTSKDVGRFRDAYISEGKIAVYTRNGGGNRDHWDFDYYDSAEGESCPCPGCVITYHLPMHPNYLSDKDDDFDSTYATIYFSIPEQFKELASRLELGEFNSDERWQQKLAEIKKASPEELKTKYPEITKVVEDIAKWAIEKG